MNIDLDIPDFIKKFHEQAKHIPFENSDFQNLAFVVANQQTPERMKRAAILKLSSILEALRENYFAFRREEIKLKQLERELKSAANQFQRELIAIDIEEINLKRLMTEKLVLDAVHSANYLQKIIDALPDIESREKFELAEPEHFDKRFTRQIELSHYQASGSLEGRANMTLDLKKASELMPELKALTERFGDIKLLES